MLFILFIFYILNFEDDTDLQNKKLVNKKNTNSTINNVSSSTTNNKNNIYTTNPSNNFVVDEPQFRGYVDYNKFGNKEQNGGSDPFKNNNINLIDTTNEVNYTTYESYRKKPIMQN